MLALLNLLHTAEQAQDHISMLDPGAPEPIETDQKDTSMTHKIHTLMAAQSRAEVMAVYADTEAVQHIATQRLQELDELKHDGVHNLEHTLESEKHLAEHAHVAQETPG